MLQTPEILNTSPKNFCYLIPGITGTKEGWKSIKQVLEKPNEKGISYQDIRAFDSSATRKPHDPDHYKKMANSFLEDFKVAKDSGGTLDFVITSLGTVDLDQMFQIIEKTDPQFFMKPENIRALRLTLIAPWGFTKGIKEALSSTKGFVELLSKVGTGEETGLISLHTILPTGIDTKTLANAMGEAYSNRRQKTNNFTPLHTLENEDFQKQSEEYRQKLTPTDRDKLESIDQDLAKAIKEKNWGDFRANINKRGKLLQTYEDNLLFGKEINAPPVDIAELKRKETQFYLSLAKNFGTVFGSTICGEPYKRISQLTKQGCVINFIIPEYDLLVSGEKIAKFVEISGDAAKLNTFDFGEATHHSTTINPHELIRVLS